MKRKFVAGFLSCAMILPLVACSNTDPNETETKKGGSSKETEEATKASSADFADGKFTETRHITVEVYNRSNDGGTDPTNNMYAKYIQDGMLKDHNVEVEFVSVPRWTEVDELNNLLAAGTAPDICVTYDYATILSYANMGGVKDLSETIETYRADTPNLWAWLGDTNMYWDKDPETGKIWAIEGKRATTNRIVTFARKDWMDTLGIKEPTTTEEFEAMLVAFRDNADKLLGDDADKMVPYSVSYDVGWRTATLLESFIDPNISDHDYYVNGFDDRKVTEPGVKDGVKLLNKWYNDDLMWDDFALYTSDSSVEDDNMKAGYVGAFTHNWDYPFRNGEESINSVLKKTVGEDAEFVAIDPFDDKNGGHNKFVTSTAGDRKIFFPDSNDEVLASMLYLDWISDPEHIDYLQKGDEGVTHKVHDDGAVEILAATGDAIMNSGMNIDYTITCNGLHLLDPEVTAKSTALNYPGIDPAIVQRADEIANIDTRKEKNINVGAIESEDGMGQVLSDKRDALYDQCVIAPVADFDSTWDKYMKEYLNAGGQDIMDEREEKFKATYGDVQNVD